MPEINFDVNNVHIPRWNELPNIDLYMDQVLNYIESSLKDYIKSDEKFITKTMINNYVKGEVVSAPIAKKYNREHIALIEEVCTLKQVLSIAEVKQVIDERYKKGEVDNAEIFNSFNALVTSKNKEAINLTKEALENIDENDLTSLTNLAVNLACTANAYITISKRILFLNKIFQEQLKNKNN